MASIEKRLFLIFTKSGFAHLNYVFIQGAMIVIFDVDGTLIGGEEQDWPSFDNALVSEAGFSPNADFWQSLEEITGKSIVRAVAETMGIEYTLELEERIRKSYLKNLRKAAPYKGDVFTPKPGAVEILNLLKVTPVFDVAIATGDFSETSRFKIGSAGLDISGIPYASCSDAALRKDIIATAAERAGQQTEDVIYVGDGVWDLRACKQLDIPFIGTGAKLERLKAAGAEYIAEDLHPSTLLPILNELVS